MGSDIDPNANLNHDPHLYPGQVGVPLPRVCGGCAFSDTAAMSAMVTKLQAELAQVKVSLQAQTTAEHNVQKQKSDLEAVVTGLRSEVSMYSFRTYTYVYSVSAWAVRLV